MRGSASGLALGELSSSWGRRRGMGTSQTRLGTSQTRLGRTAAKGMDSSLFWGAGLGLSPLHSGVWQGS